MHLHTVLTPTLATLMLATEIQGAGFEIQSHHRSVSINGTVSILLSDASEPMTLSKSSFESKTETAPGAYDSAVGLSGFALTTPDGEAGGSGRASAKGVANAAGISYDGFADVFLGGYSVNGLASGSGGAGSSFQVTWTVSSRTPVQFEITQGADPVFGEFGIVWNRVGGPEVFAWNSTGDGLPGGGSSWSADYVLEPGTYTLQSSLTAYSQFEGEQGFSGRSTGSYRITVIPEPESSVPVLGLVILLFLRISRGARKGRGTSES